MLECVEKNTEEQGKKTGMKHKINLKTSGSEVQKEV